MICEGFSQFLFSASSPRLKYSNSKSQRRRVKITHGCKMCHQFISSLFVLCYRDALIKRDLFIFQTTTTTKAVNKKLKNNIFHGFNACKTKMSEQTAKKNWWDDKKMAQQNNFFLLLFLPFHKKGGGKIEK